MNRLKYIVAAFVILFFSHFALAQDMTAPEAECLDVDTILLDEATQWFSAAMMDGGSTDDSTAPEDLRFAFSENPTDTLRQFICHNTQKQVVNIFVFDEAGNYDECYFFVTMRYAGCADTVDVKLPTAACTDGLATTVYSTQGSVNIHAKSFDASSFDDRTADDKLRFSFSTNPADSLMTIPYDSLDNSGFRNVRIYVHDEAGNYDFCTTSIFLNFRPTIRPDSIGHHGDSIPPSLLVRQSLGQLFLPTSGAMCLSVDDFLVSVSDNETPSDLIELSFDSIYNVPFACVTCGMLTDPFNTLVELPLYARDTAGNVARIVVSYLIADFDMLCDSIAEDTAAPLIGCTEDTLAFYLTAVDSLNQYEIPVTDDVIDSEDLVYVNSTGGRNNVITYSCADTGVVNFMDLYVQDINANADVCRQYYTVIDTAAICEPSSISNYAINETLVYVYPNPSTGDFFIESDMPLRAIRIYSMQGRLLATQFTEIDQRKHYCQLANLARGSYIIRAESRQGQVVSELLIKY